MRSIPEEAARRVVITEGASGTLAKQAIEGAPYDVFVSADRARVTELRGAGLVAESSVYANGKLVAWFSARFETPIETGAQFVYALREVKTIAMPNPAHAPYGVAAEQFLRSSGELERLRERMVLCESVAHARQLLATGNADVAFLPASLVKGEANVFALDSSLYEPIQQEAALLVRGRDNPVARAVYQQLFSAEGRALFERDGYLVPSAAKP